MTRNKNGTSTDLKSKATFPTQSAAKTFVHIMNYIPFGDPIGFGEEDLVEVGVCPCLYPDLWIAENYALTC